MHLTCFSRKLGALYTAAKTDIEVLLSNTRIVPRHVGVELLNSFNFRARIRDSNSSNRLGASTGTK